MHSLLFYIKTNFEKKMFETDNKLGADLIGYARHVFFILIAK